MVNNLGVVSRGGFNDTRVVHGDTRIAQTNHFDHGTDDVRRNRALTGRREDTVVSRARIRTERDRTNQRALVVVRREVENRRGGRLEHRDEHDTVDHAVERAGDNLKLRTAVEVEHELNVTLTLGVKVIEVRMDVVAAEDRAEDERAREHAERDLGTRRELLLQERGREEARHDLVQANLHELLDVTRRIRAADREEARTEIERVEVRGLVNHVASGVGRSDFSVRRSAVAELETLIVDVLERLGDDADVVAVTTDVLNLSETRSRVRRALLTDRKVDDEVAASGEFERHVAAVDLETDARLPLVVLVVTSVEREADELEGEGLGERLVFLRHDIGRIRTTDRELAERLRRSVGRLTIDLGLDVRTDGEELARRHRESSEQLPWNRTQPWTR